MCVCTHARARGFAFVCLYVTRLFLLPSLPLFYSLFLSFCFSLSRCLSLPLHLFLSLSPSPSYHHSGIGWKTTRFRPGAQASRKMSCSTNLESHPSQRFWLGPGDPRGPVPRGATQLLCLDPQDAWTTCGCRECPCLCLRWPTRRRGRRRPCSPTCIPPAPRPPPAPTSPAPSRSPASTCGAATSAGQ